jgi:hypothetical protein
MAKSDKIPYEIYLLSSYGVLSTGTYVMPVSLIAVGNEELVPAARTR